MTNTPAAFLASLKVQYQTWRIWATDGSYTAARLDGTETIHRPTISGLAGELGQRASPGSTSGPQP